MSMITVPSDGIIKSYKYIPGSCGVPVPGSEIRILRDDGSEADVNEPGNLFYRGPNVALGYYGNEQATRETFSSDGWLKTGDRFRCDGTNLL
jgi:long-subunit acyl-CoA synthetase (AMP-forming)